jgi:penicillin-binding protein 2
MHPKDRRLRWQPDTPDDGEPDKGPMRRLTLLRLFVVGVFAVLVLQLAHVQIANGYRYKLLAQNNLIKVIPNSPARGLVFDRMGRPLVQNLPVFSAVVVPSQLPDEHREDVYYALQSNLGISAADVEQQVNDSIKRNGPDTPVVIKSDIDETTALKLAELRSTTPAIDVKTQPSRSYTMGSLVSRVLGYVGKVDESEYKTLSGKGYQLDDQVGKTGIELSYEDKLRGVPGKRAVEVDAAGHELRQIQEVPSQPGDNITLTIDSTLQQGITTILQNSLLAYKSASGVAIMMDVHTGEILAYVSLPSYDDNLFSGPVSSSALQQLLSDPGRPLVDHAVSDQYPPGSTFKEITGLAALQEGVATANTTIVTNGKLVVENQGDPSQHYVFPDWTNLGTLNFIRGVAMSSDVYFYCLAGGCPQFGHDGLGSDALARYARMFGLGEKTGIDLPDEVPGIVPDRQWKERTIHEPWVTADTYFMGIGQEYLATTPLQMLRVVAAIANGGDILRPHLVHEIRNPDGSVVPPSVSNVVRHVAVSPENIAIMRQGMLQVVQSGSAPEAQVPGVAIAGKSGTAEYGNQLTSPAGEEANGTYNEHGWFVSYAPYDNPQVALVVFHERGGGALSAAPTTSQIWDYYFHQYLPQRQAAQAAAGATPTP